MSLPLLEPSEFPDFFRQLHGEGKEAFDWQTRLARQLATEGEWPRVLSLPTGSGKTAAIDIALFHLALEASNGQVRRAPLRIALVVDRRVIVDAAYERASRIAKQLEAALHHHDPANVLSRVARRLASLSGDGPPLVVRALRGGAPRENDWARTPSQPTVLCSTVDQVGSRLLFRGYGVSDSMKPVHAGLIGSDCLILLDEAHLSEPFRQTLEAIERFGRPPWTERPGAPWAYVTLTATPAGAAERIFSLKPDERIDPRLAPRLSVPKIARLASAKARASQPAAHASELAEHAWDLSGIASADTSPRIVAIVVNRVALARRCHAEICKRINTATASAEAALFIGRSRDVDREALMDRYRNALLSERKQPEKTLFVVATQCIEAGADFDFDALVTQIAPLDSLRQRFGRLNRMGRDIPARAAILACADEVSSRTDDPLYGTTSKRTWDWLLEHSARSEIDFGIDAMEAQLKGESDEILASLVTRKRDAPVVMPAYVDLWAQTHPIPNADPEPALFLHGAPDSADVQIVWRADIDRNDLFVAETRERPLRLLSLMPPRSAEAVAVPIRAARAWLSGKAAISVNDVEGGTNDEESTTAVREVPAFRWRGPDSDDSRFVKSWELRPGDLVVVSSTEGGCDGFGWRPEHDEFVPDVADAAALPYARRRFVFRLHRRLLESAVRSAVAGNDHTDLESIGAVWRSVQRALLGARNERNGAKVARAIADADGIPDSWKEALDALANAKGAVSAVFPYDEEESSDVSGVVFIAPQGVLIDSEKQTTDDGEASTEADDAGSFRKKPVELARHASDVGKKARHFAQLAGLPAEIVGDVALAALLHDEGKRDGRFQLYLRRGDRLQLALDKKVLAKSDKGIESRRQDALIRKQAELPERWRHEADSVMRALKHSRISEAHDPQLVLWLIGTHHGYGRPLFPHTDPTCAGPQDMDFQYEGDDWPTLFSRLLRRYGPWELARLESIVRLADHRASEDEEREVIGAGTAA